MTAIGRTAARIASVRLVRTTAALLLALALLAVVGPLFSPHGAIDTGFDRILAPPGLAGGHVFGTDNLGRDLFVRTLEGTRTTLLVATVASIVSLLIGVVYGTIAGYVGGRVDAVMMRVVDTLYALPFIFLVILLMVAFERNFLLIFVAIGAVNWLDMARIVRGQTLALKEKEFIEAARLIGVPTRRVLLRHVAPNLLGVVLVYLTLTIPQAVLVESFLSFLGLGIQEPATSLGTLVANGVGVLEQAPWVLLIPSAFLFVILLLFNFLGDGLRDAFDVRLGMEERQ
jgi:oligopeptide transport system permease protein